MQENELKYLKSIANIYPTIAAAATEIINLQSILNLPKGTEHFLTDIHGEHEQFLHVLKNGSGSVRKKIDEEFGNTLSVKDKKSLATLIYYPQKKLELVETTEENLQDWYKITLYRLIEICKRVASKYTRSKVRKALPRDFSYIIEELITEKAEVQDKEAYYNAIIETILRIGKAQDFIIAIAELIQRLVVDHLHIVGDIFDRGPGPHIILDQLMDYHSVDIQWGNHDVLWMGAASGHLACIANVIRISAKYGNLKTLEEGYGINLIPLATFALDTYGDDACTCFGVQESPRYQPASERELEKKMHKAITMIQFKLEGQLIMRRPCFGMEDRLLLGGIDRDHGIVTINGKVYPLKDCSFPTLAQEDPYALTAEEQLLMERLQSAFIKCEKLQKHVRFLYSKGSLYKVFNGNLLYHGCIPFDSDGNFNKIQVFDQAYSGKALYDVLEKHARKGYYCTYDEEERLKGQDILWFLWSSEKSPVYGKEKMATLERYLLDDKEVQLERKNDYYRLIEEEETVNAILEEFGLDKERGHIINGHMPVQLQKGETPVKCGGKLLIIDGGFSKAYQKVTGIAGYTLVYNSYGLRLAAHEPFTSVEDAVLKETDIHSETTIVEQVSDRRTVKDTDAGQEIQERIYELEMLLAAYRNGMIVEKISK